MRRASPRPRSTCTPPVRQAAPFAVDLGCRFLEGGSVEVDDLGHTSIPGVYAVGDMA